MILCVCPNPSVDTIVDVGDLSPGRVHRARSEQHFAGGKGVHVALAARGLGAEVTLLALWAGPTGQWIRSQCESAGITCLGPEVGGWSRRCITFRSPSAYDQTELLGCGPTVTVEQVCALTDQLRLRVDEAAVVTLSGSWPAGAPDMSYADLIDAVRAAGKPAVLDCTGAALRAAVGRRPAAVHLNRDEAVAAMQVDDPVAAAGRLLVHTSLAIITAGARGAYFAWPDAALHATCAIEAEHSSVGSGDCLVAGVAVAIERGLDRSATAALACACGAANCLRPELGMLHRRDVEMLTPRVQVRELP